MTRQKYITSNLCPKCSANRTTLKAMLEEPWQSPNAQSAMWIIDDCRDCKSYFVTMAQDQVADKCPVEVTHVV